MRIVLLLLANIGFVPAELVLAPSNEVVVAGEFMSMNCLTSNNSTVRNWDIFTSNMEPFTIYTPGKLHRLFSHFGVDADDNGSGMLYTNSTKLSDAGIYKCLSIIEGQDKEHSAQLTVLEFMPKCQESFSLNSLNTSSSSMTGDYIWMQCSISFRGFWTPTMEWIEYGGLLGPEGRSVSEGVELRRIPSRIVTSNLTVVVNSSKDGSRFACKIYFSKYDGRYNTTAGNVPGFTYNWTSRVIILSISTALEEEESSTAVRTTLEGTISTDWYLMSLSLVAALSVFFIIILVFVVAFCIRFKKKLSATYASVTLGEIEKPIHDENYDMLPYATSDNYDTIDDIVVKVSFVPRQGPLPTPGYSGLTKTDSAAPEVYSSIETYTTPSDITPVPRDGKVLATLETIVKRQVDDSKEKKDGKGEINLQQEVGLGLTQSPPNQYIEVFDVVEADDPEECKKTSDQGISSSYITVNF